MEQQRCEEGMLSHSTQRAVGAPDHKGDQACSHIEAASGIVMEPWRGFGPPLWMGTLGEGMGVL